MTTHVPAIRYLSLAEVVALYRLVMDAAGTHGHLLDAGKLESALLRPRMIAHYEDGDLFVQAAALITEIALAHPFSDGNKRLALLASDVFLALNGTWIRSEPLAFAMQIMAFLTRDGDLGTATEALAEWLRTHAIAYVNSA